MGVFCGAGEHVEVRERRADEDGAARGRGEDEPLVEVDRDNEQGERGENHVLQQAVRAERNFVGADPEQERVEPVPEHHAEGEPGVERAEDGGEPAEPGGAAADVVSGGDE